MYYARFYVRNPETGALGYDDQGLKESDTLNPGHLEFPVPENTLRIDFYDDTRDKVIKRAFYAGEVLSQAAIISMDLEDRMKASGATSGVYVEGVNKVFPANANDLIYNPKTESFDWVRDIAATLAEQDATEDAEDYPGRHIGDEEGDVLPEVPPYSDMIVPGLDEIVPDNGPRYIPGITAPAPKF